MTRRRWEQLLWTVALGLALGGWVRWRQALPAVTRPASPSLAAPSPIRGIVPARLDSVSDAVARSNPFRLDRSPAPLGSAQLPRPGMPIGPGYAPSGVPSHSGAPQIRVAGISGPPWEAILEGIPNRQGAVVVREGDRLGDLRIRSISSALVVVQGRDSTWRLPIKGIGP